MDDPVWQVVRIDMATGAVSGAPSTSEIQRHAFRPLVSPDGRYLGYIQRRDGITSLRIRELASGRERALLSPVEHDIVGASKGGVFDLFPGYAFTPDSRSLVITAEGKLWRIEVTTGNKVPIPFTATVDQHLADLNVFERSIDDSDTVLARQIRFPAMAPDGRALAFNALGRVWVKDLRSGTTRRITDGQVFEDYPAWSPDGKYLAFTTWHDAYGGDVVRVDVRCLARPPCKPENLSQRRGYYAKLAYTPDGSQIIAVRGPWPILFEQQRSVSLDRSLGHLQNELIRFPSAGGTATLIALTEADNPFLNDEVALPHFSAADDGVLFWQKNPGVLRSVSLDGARRRDILKATTGNSQPETMQVSPDGRFAVAAGRWGIQLAPVSPAASSVVHLRLPVDARAPHDEADPSPVRGMRFISHLGEQFVRWAPDSQSFYYSLGHTVFEYDLRLAIQRGARYRPRQIDVQARQPRDRPAGLIALRGARLITMKGDEVIGQGDILIEDHRIRAIGAAGSIHIPAQARIVDVSGKTILPGYIDVHDHPFLFRSSTQPAAFLASVAFGVTTARDPSIEPYQAGYGDRVATGELIGPRYFTVSPAPRLDFDTMDELEPYREMSEKAGSRYYNTGYGKQYAFGDRRVRQLAYLAWRELRVSAANHGEVGDALSMILDGVASIDHPNIIGFPIHEDYLQLLSASGTTWVPTLLPAGASMPMLRRYDLHDEWKLRRFTPHHDLDYRWYVASESEHIAGVPFAHQLTDAERAATSAAAIMSAGGKVGLGAHGELPGLGAHLELWALSLGGMRSHDVLRSGTIVGAQVLGLERDLGSLERGKLADLQVLDANPLEKIENTNTLRYVMANGRLYEAGTLNEIWPRDRPLPRMWWWDWN
jgi:hypothetical protein